MMANDGSVVAVFVGNSPILKNIYNSNSLDYIISWKRGGLSKFNEVGLVF